MQEENVIYSWSFSDKKERTSKWYIISFTILISLIIWGFFSRFYMMSFVLILFTGVYFFIENNSPDTITVKLTNLGIKIENTFYDYSKILSYSFLYFGENACLIRLKINKSNLKYIDLKITNEIVNNLKPIISDYVEENQNEEMSFLEKLLSSLKI